MDGFSECLIHIVGVSCNMKIKGSKREKKMWARKLGKARREIMQKHRKKKTSLCFQATEP